MKNIGRNNIDRINLVNRANCIGLALLYVYCERVRDVDVLWLCR